MEPTEYWPKGSCGRMRVAAYKDSTPQKDLYRAFSAAYDGCVKCVEKALDEGEVLVNQRSDSAAFDLMQWAVWGQIKARNNTTEVQELLLARGATRQPDCSSAKTAFPAIRDAVPGGTGYRSRRPRCAERHTKACNVANTGPKYQFFSAAFAGCRWCVQWYVQNGLDPAIESDSRSHNALDWAVFGHEQGQQTDWVAGFLVAKGVQPVWVEDPESSEEWQPVEPLGTRGGGC